MRPTSDPRFGYPVFLDLQDILVLVVGGGRIAARKAEGLAAAGALVRLVAREVSDHVDRSRCSEVHERAFAAEDLADVRLVITATGSVEVDHEIALAARSRGIWTNAADQPDDCEFILPAIARSGRVTVAVSTDGASPALAQALRDKCAALATDDVATLADTLAAERAAIRDRGGSTEDVDWSQRIQHVLGSD